MRELERVFREHHGVAIASLVGMLGSIDAAEDAAAEAFAVAASHWPVHGVPPNPAGWITTTARRRAIDRFRREASREDRHAQAALLHPNERGEEVGPVTDDRLRLLFTCCHPALAPEARVALTLRLLGGLSTAEIARAFLVPEPTMAQRLVRAKAKIRNARIPFRVPEAEDLPDRLAAVLAVVYLVYGEAHTASAGADLVRPDLAAEAVRLARVLADLLPDEPEALGLLALLLLLESRRPARVGVDGGFVALRDQDRSRWDAALVREGHALVRRCLAIDRPGPYQLQAAINAVHADAPSVAATDWTQVVALYDRLHTLTPTPVVALNRAVAVAEADGAAVGLALVDRIDGLDGYHLYWAVRAELLARVGRGDEAASAYRRAIALTGNERERAHLESRSAEL